MIRETYETPDQLTGEELMTREKDAPTLCPNVDGDLAAYLRAAAQQCQYFTTAELQAGAVTIMAEIGPMTTEWLARCRAAMGDKAFMECAPESPQLLREYRTNLNQVLPLYEARLARTEPPFPDFPGDPR